MIPAMAAWRASSPVAEAGQDDAHGGGSVAVIGGERGALVVSHRCSRAG